MKNLMTFDLEDWYHGNFLDENIFGKNDVDRVVEPTLTILEMLQESGNSATFFVLGCVAEKHPELIKKIHQQGHEIASHSYEHNLIYKLNKNEFQKDVEKSVKILEGIIGDKIIGYRAPYWSINYEMEWVWESLKQNGIIYDSSIYPFKTYYYGDNNASRFKHNLSWNENNSLIEIPPSTLEIMNNRIPFCGGFYFRILPYWVVRWAINRINNLENYAAVFYLHPYEIDVNKPRSSKGFRNNFILHVNIKKAEKKLRKIMKDFKFVSIKDYLS